VISRYLVIALALGTAVYRLSQGAMLEAFGLVGLGTGLLFLKLGERWPALRRFSRPAFAMTVIAIITALYRIWQAKSAA
jgi:hypothetical protein